MMDYRSLEMQRERCRDMLREAQQHRLRQIALNNRPAAVAVYRPLWRKLAGWLAANLRPVFTRSTPPRTLAARPGALDR